MGYDVKSDAKVGMMRGQIMLTNLYEIGSMQYNKNMVLVSKWLNSKF